jgi:nicotinamidase-related amidase
VKETPMPVTSLAPKTALIIIDLQNGIVSLPTVHAIEAVIKRVSTLAAEFRAQGLPVARSAKPARPRKSSLY